MQGQHVRADLAEAMGKISERPDKVKQVFGANKVFLRMPGACLTNLVHLPGAAISAN